MNNRNILGIVIYSLCIYQITLGQHYEQRRSFDLDPQYEPNRHYYPHHHHVYRQAVPSQEDTSDEGVIISEDTAEEGSGEEYDPNCFSEDSNQDSVSKRETVEKQKEDEEISPDEERTHRETILIDATGEKDESLDNDERQVIVDSGPESGIKKRYVVNLKGVNGRVSIKAKKTEKFQYWKRKYNGMKKKNKSQGNTDKPTCVETTTMSSETTVPPSEETTTMSSETTELPCEETTTMSSETTELPCEETTTMSSETTEPPCEETTSDCSVCEGETTTTESSKRKRNLETESTETAEFIEPSTTPISLAELIRQYFAGTTPEPLDTENSNTNETSTVSETILDQETSETKSSNSTLNETVIDSNISSESSNETANIDTTPDYETSPETQTNNSTLIEDGIDANIDSTPDYETSPETQTSNSTSNDAGIDANIETTPVYEKSSVIQAINPTSNETIAEIIPDETKSSRKKRSADGEEDPIEGLNMGGMKLKMQKYKGFFKKSGKTESGSQCDDGNEQKSETDDLMDRFNEGVKTLYGNTKQKYKGYFSMLNPQGTTEEAPAC